VLSTSRGRRKKRIGDRDGQALVEFAFVAIFLLLVIFGVIDFGRLFFAYATMSNGVREGARYGIVHPPLDPSDPADPNTQQIITRAHAMMVLIGAEAVVTVEYPGGDDPSDPDYPPGCTTPHVCRIEVTATSGFDMWTPVIPSLSLETHATMHFE
jgi:hypothetical protein